MYSGVLLAALVAGVLFVNGFTDAPNAITGVVRAMVLAWGVTFPVCFAVGWFVTAVSLR